MGFWDRFRRSYVATTDTFADFEARDVAEKAALPALPEPLAPSNSIVSVPAGYELIRAEQLNEGKHNIEMPPVEAAQGDPKALYWDPFALIEQLGFRDRPSSVTYQTLNAMVWRMPIVQAIIQTRINQVSAFCTPQTHRSETGFRVKMRDREASPKGSDKKFAQEMERMLLQSGARNRDPLHLLSELLV